MSDKGMFFIIKQVSKTKQRSVGGTKKRRNELRGNIKTANGRNNRMNRMSSFFSC
jgi:hypothetical protein